MQASSYLLRSLLPLSWTPALPPRNDYFANAVRPIDNPYYSRPIDVHRWSDHPEVKELTDKVWDHLPEDITGVRGNGGKRSFAAPWMNRSGAQEADFLES